MTPEALMRKVAKGFEKGDLQPLLDAIDENTVWKAGPLQNNGPLRFGGEYKKRAGVLEITSQLATLYVFQRFEPREIIASDEVVWGLFDVEGEYRPTGKSVKLVAAIRWCVRNDMILEHQGFFDTISLLWQQGSFPQS
jgi:ketosteroid isomerase-like protein